MLVPWSNKLKNLIKKKQNKKKTGNLLLLTQSFLDF